MRTNEVVLGSLAGLAILTGTIGFCAPAAKAEKLVAAVPSQLPALVDEAAIQKILADFIKAAGNTKTVDALIVEHVAPFVMTEFKAETSNQQMTMLFEGRDELRAHMKQAYASIKEVEYLEKKATTRFIENGKVMIADISSLQRITTTAGKSYISRNLSTAVFTMVDGKLQVTSYISNAQIDRRP